MKTTKKRIQKKSRPNKTQKRNVKRKSRKAMKTHKRKYRNKKYTGEGGTPSYEETGFGFDDPAEQPCDPVYNNQDDETTSCPRGHDSVERKGKVCNNCIAYLQKFFIIK